MPRLSILVANGGPEIIHAAVSLAAMLTIYRLVEQPSAVDLVLLLTWISFAISLTGMMWVFGMLLLPLTFVVLIRRHGKRFMGSILRRRWAPMLLFLGPVALFTVYPIKIYRISGLFSFWGLPLNSDGIQGAAANLLRYLLEAVHLTAPVDLICRRVAAWSPREAIESVYFSGVQPFLGSAGATTAYGIDWAPEPAAAWFGPFGFAFVLPAVVYAAIRGPRRLKAVAVALLGYFYLMTLIPAWGTNNAALFTPFFVVGGFCTAFLLPPWRFSQRAKNILQLVCFALLFYALLFNPAGPLASIDLVN